MFCFLFNKWFICIFVIRIFQWKTTDDENALFNLQMPVSRIRSISRGITTPMLQQAAAHDRKSELLSHC